jgi:hypothetical protein
MPNIQQIYHHQQLRNSFTPEQLHVTDKELARSRQARGIALEQGGDPKIAGAGGVGERDPNVGTGDQQPVGTDTVDDQDHSKGADNLQTPAAEEGTQNPTNERTEEQATAHPTSTTTTTASSTFNRTSITFTGPLLLPLASILLELPPLLLLPLLRRVLLRSLLTLLHLLPLIRTMKKRVLRSPIVNTRRRIVLRILVQTKSRISYI